MPRILYCRIAVFGTLLFSLQSCATRSFESSSRSAVRSSIEKASFPAVASTRATGVLLHPTSFPGPYGIGELGREAYQTIDFFEESGFTLWQVMPMGPTGFGDSPYSSYSAFALNPLLISIEKLIEMKLLEKSTANELKEKSKDNETKVDFGEIYTFKIPLLKLAFEKAKTNSDLWNKVKVFVSQQQDWIEDFATFAALKEEFGGAPWVSWSESAAKDKTGKFTNVKDLIDGVEKHQKQKIDAFTQNLAGNKIVYNKEFNFFTQYIAYQQWQKLREYANSKGIAVVSDVPYYVGHDSADVWANRNLFRLKETGEELFVSGVPGQRWGHPVFDWEEMRKQNYDWWIKRFKILKAQSDYIRVDHFLAFAKYYQFEKSNPNHGGYWEEYVAGRKMADYGNELFEALAKTPEFSAKAGQDNRLALPFVVEDLGEQNGEMFQMRDRFEMAGVNIYLYTLEKQQDSREEIKYFPNRSVVYTGTHDNETAVGFALSHGVDRFGWDALSAHRRMREGLFYDSSSNWVILPMQDVLGKDNASRMNVPGRADGNWHWRFEQNEVSAALSNELLEHVCKSNRRNANDSRCGKFN